MLLPPIAAALLIVSPQAVADQVVTDAPTPGTITIELVEGQGAKPALDAPFAEAVDHALLGANFLVLPPGTPSRYVAEVAVTRTAQGLATTDAREDSAATNVGDWGAQLHVTLPSKKRQTHGLIVTTLDVRIMLRDGERPVWHGSALTAQAQGTDAGAPAAVAAKLADAVMARYPTPTEQPIAVP